LQIFVRWAISAVALYITVLIVEHFKMHIWLAPGLAGVIASVIAVVVLAVVNAIIRPIVKLLALPITCLTLGLFSFVINAMMFWVVGQVVPGFHVRGFVAPLFASIVMGLISGILSSIIVSDGEKDKKK
jgi:putative membrane protein